MIEKEKLIYSKKILKQLKKNLGNPIKFNNSSYEYQKKIAKKIKNDFNIECLVKNFSRARLKNSINNLDDSMKKEKKLFIKDIEIILNKKVTRKNSSDFKAKFYKCVESIILFLKNERDITPNLNDKMLDNIYNKVSSEDIFYLLIFSILSKMTPMSSLNDLWDAIDEKSDFNITISSVDLFYCLRKNAFYYILSKLNVNQNYSNETITFLKENEHRLFEEENLIYLIKQIELVAEKSILNKSILKKSGNDKHSRTFYIIPKDFSDYKPIAAHLPEIIEPKTWDIKELEDSIELSKKINNGESNVDYSNKTLNSLSISQKKKMVISENAIEIFKSLDELTIEEYNQIDISPVIPLSVYLAKIEEVRRMTKFKLDYKLYNSINQTKKEMFKLKKYDKNLFIEEVYKKFSVNCERLDLNERYIKSVRELRIYKVQREIYKSILVMSEIFKGFPIYFLNKVDYRLRMYPWSFLFSRTTGIYKYFLKDFDSVKLTNKGLFRVLQSYYYTDSDLYNNFSKLSGETLEVMLSFYSVNKINISSTSNYLYFKLLEIEINQSIKNNLLFNFMIEIDQRSSSSVFLSIILRNRKLFEYSNLLNRKDYDIPKYLSTLTRSYFNKLGITNEKVIDEFINNRQMHKSSFMTFCYNQEKWGRRMDWRNILQSYSEDDFIALESFSSNYENFLDEAFPNLKSQKNKLNEIVLVLIASYKGIVIKTIDGSVIRWKIFKTKDVIKKIKNPLDSEYKSFRYKRILLDDIDVNKLKTSFIPGLIHSIDAAIIRILISKIHKKGYIINHVHDSIMIHPNYLDDVYEELLNIYIESSLNDNVLEKCFIKPVLEIVNDKARIVIESLYKELLELGENVSVVKKNLDIQYLYRFEK